jgi:hypothetical protein
MLSLLSRYLSQAVTDPPELPNSTMYSELEPFVPPNILEPCRTLIARYEVENTVSFRMSLDDEEERAWALLKTYLRLVADMSHPSQETRHIAQKYIS